jgi:hypothetical protein
MFEDEVARARAFQETARQATEDENARVQAARDTWDNTVLALRPSFETAINRLLTLRPPTTEVIADWTGWGWAYEEPTIHDGNLHTPSGVIGRIWWRFDRPPLYPGRKAGEVQEWVLWSGWSVSMLTPWAGTHNILIPEFRASPAAVPTSVNASLHVARFWDGRMETLDLAVGTDVISLADAITYGPCLHVYTSPSGATEWIPLDAHLVLAGIVELVATYIALRDAGEAAAAAEAGAAAADGDAADA